MRVRVAERNADTHRDRYRRAIETTEHGNDELQQECCEERTEIMVYYGGSSL